jgi:hypothetical protein
MHLWRTRTRTKPLYQIIPEVICAQGELDLSGSESCIDMAWREIGNNQVFHRAFASPGGRSLDLFKWAQGGKAVVGLVLRAIV